MIKTAPVSKSGKILARLLKILGITAIIVVLVGGVLVFFAYRKAETLLPKTPPPLPQPTSPAATANNQTGSAKPALTQPDHRYQTEVKPKLQKFYHQLNQSGDAEIVLSAAELNAIVHQSPEYKHSGALLYFTIEGNSLVAHASAPLHGIPFLEGRYFAGTVTLNPAPPNYGLPMEVAAIDMNGQQIPSFVLTYFQNPANVRTLLDHYGVAAEVNQIRSVHIRAGLLYLRVARQPES